MINSTFSLLLISKSFQMSHPQKSDLGPGGEDSFFISSDNRSIGVADGVGGWRKQEESFSHKWSHSIMELCNNYTLSGLSPVESVRESYKQLDKTLTGSTTVSVAQLISYNEYMKRNESKETKYSNDITNETINEDTYFIDFYTIGDSLCSIIRPHVGFLFTTNKTYHEFNFPYQLGSRQVSEVDDGTIEAFPIQKGDLLLCASDGVWDNLFSDEIQNIIETQMNKFHIDSKEQDLSNFMKETARQIVRQSYIRGSKHNTETPFSNGASKAGLDFIGGKLDDTTAVLSYVIQNNNSDNDQKINQDNKEL